MPDTTDLLLALRDVGIEAPAAGDAGDARARAALQRAIERPRRFRRRVRLPFATRSIALAPAALLVAVVATAAAGSVALVGADPTTLFEANPGNFGNPAQIHQTVIPSTVREIDSYRVPGIGEVQYWVADTEQHGLCQAMRLPNKTWAVVPGTIPNTAGQVPACGPTRQQEVRAQGNSLTGLAPTSVDEQSISLKNPSGLWWDVYYGIVNADGAAGVKDQANGRTTPLIDGRYFVLVVPLGPFRRGMCMGCDNLRAIDSAGHALPANYGPEQYRNH